jgi:hypothetical protein
MNAPLHRLFFYTADLKLMTGKSERTCQRILQLIRDGNGLQKHQPITVFHVCDYLGIPLEKLLPFIR